MTSFSGPFKYHLEEIINIGAPGLLELFQNCENFPEIVNKHNDELKAFLVKHRQKNTFYSGMHFITRSDVEREEKLRKVIKKFVDEGQENNLFTGLKALEIRKLIQQFIKNKGEEFAWAHKPYKKTILDYLHLYGAPLIAALILILLMVSSILWFNKKLLLKILIMIAMLLIISIIYIESGKNKVAERLPDKKMRLIAITQKHPVINELTAAGPVKKGFLRRIIFRAVLKVISLFTGIISIPTIATARWIAADKGKRLVFISNYSNTSDSYVRDFIDSRSSARLINLLFGHGEGYPKTRMLLYRGALDAPEGFMNVFHQNQHITQFWYCPCKTLSVDNIKNNRKIRNGLFGNICSTKRAQEWLHCL